MGELNCSSVDAGCLIAHLEQLRTGIAAWFTFYRGVSAEIEIIVGAAAEGLSAKGAEGVADAVEARDYGVVSDRNTGPDGR